MNNKIYQKIVNELTPKENRLYNLFISFISGGTIGIIGTLLYNLLINNYDKKLSISFMLLILIVIIAFITSLGKADTLFTKFKCGLIIPITGFAHSIASCIIDYKKEGFINIGSNTFKLAGSVILYGVISAWFFGMIRYLIGVIS